MVNWERKKMVKTVSKSFRFPPKICEMIKEIQKREGFYSENFTVMKAIEAFYKREYSLIMKCLVCGREYYFVHKCPSEIMHYLIRKRR